MNQNEHVVTGCRTGELGPGFGMKWQEPPQQGFLERLLHWYSLSLTTQITLALLGPFHRTLSLEQKVLYENVETSPVY